MSQSEHVSSEESSLKKIIASLHQDFVPVPISFSPNPLFPKNKQTALSVVCANNLTSHCQQNV